MLRAATFGLGSMDHSDPFQFSMKAAGWNPPPPPPPKVPEEPTAQHWVALTQERLFRMDPVPAGSGTEEDTSVHDTPFHCSMRIPDAFPVSSVNAPEAQQSDTVAQVTP